MTTLCYAKGTCAIGIHVLLEEVGKPYDLQKVDFSKQEQQSPEYKKINPKGKVPALVRDDGSVLTEYAAISTWLALNNPDKNLMPTDRGVGGLARHAGRMVQIGGRAPGFQATAEAEQEGHGIGHLLVARHCDERTGNEACERIDRSIVPKTEA